jgi:hypothetical protein
MRRESGIKDMKLLMPDPRSSFPYNGKYSFSLKNQLRAPIKNVFCLVIFCDSQTSPIDLNVLKYPGVILPGLAKRVSGSTDASVQKLTTPRRSATPNTRIEFRILDFQIVE